MGYKAVALNTGLIKIREIQSYNRHEYVNINANVSVSGNMNVLGNTIINSDLASVNFNDGALQVKGGASIQGNLNLKHNLNVGGEVINGEIMNSVLVVKHPYVVPTGSDAGTRYAYRVGINTSHPKCSLDVSGTDAIKLPSGSRTERPINPKTGMIRYNTELSLFEGYGQAWGSLGGSSDIDADTDINVDQYYESTPSADNDDDIIRFTTRGKQNMIIDHTGKVGLGKNYHQAVSEQEIMDAYIKYNHFTAGIGTVTVNNNSPSQTEYNAGVTAYNSASSVARRDGWAQASLAGFNVPKNTSGGINKYDGGVTVLEDINYLQKTGGDINYSTFANYLSKLPQSTLEIHGNVSISENLNVGGYIMMPINKQIYLSEDKKDYIVSKDDGGTNNHLEIRCTDGDINLTSGGDIVIPSNTSLLFGSKYQSIKENGNNDIIINTTGDFTNTIGNDYIVNSSSDNNLISTSSKIELTSSNNNSENSIDIKSNLGGINLKGNDSKKIDMTAGQILIESKENTSDSIKLESNGGSNETIKIINHDGTQEPAILVNSLQGGIEVSSDKTTSLVGGKILIETTSNIDQSILIQTNNGGTNTNETILIENKQGTSDESIKIQSLLGGIDLQSNKDINLISDQKINFNSNNSGFQFIGTSSDTSQPDEIVVDITNSGKTILKDITDSSRTDNELNTAISAGWSLRNDVDFATEFNNVAGTALTNTATTSANGTNATLNVTVEGGNINSVTVGNNSGSGYKIGDTLTFDTNKTFTLKRHHLDIKAEDKIRPDPSLLVEGGALVGKDLWIQQNVNVLQNLNVFGNNIQIQAEQLVIDDPLIVVGINQNSSNATADFSYSGIMNRYRESSQFKFSGLVRVPTIDGNKGTWSDQISGSDFGGSWHFLDDIEDLSDDNQHPDNKFANLNDRSKHSDLHLSQLKLLGDTNSTTFSSGALVLTSGGLAVNKQVNIGSNKEATSVAGSADTGALVVKGGISLGKNIFLNKENGGNNKIQWSTTQYINVDSSGSNDILNINSDTGKIRLNAANGGSKSVLGNIQFKHGANDTFAFDNTGRIKVDGNLVLDVNGDIILDVPDETKHVSFRVNEQKFFSIFNDGSNNAILKNTYETNDKHIILKSSKDLELIRFTDTLVKLNENVKLQIGSDALCYIKHDSTNVVLNVNNDLIFSTGAGTEVMRIDKTNNLLKMTDDTKITFGDSNQYISGNNQANKLTLDSANDIIFKLSNIEILRASKGSNSLKLNSTNKVVFENVNNYIYGDTNDLYIGSNTVNFNSDIRIPTNSKLYIGSDNQYVTSDGSNINFEFIKTDVKFKAGSNSDVNKKIILESDGNIELTAGVSSSGIVKILNTTQADTQTGALRVDGGISVAENVVSTGFVTHGPLELRDKVFYVPQILYYASGSADGSEIELSKHTVLSIISVENTMSDHYYVELPNGIYNGQIKKIVLHPRYEVHRQNGANYYHINIDIDNFCDPDGGTQTNATLILNRGGQTLNLVWTCLDPLTYSGQATEGYWLLLDNNFDFL